MRKIRGNTVGTTISPEKLADKIGGGGGGTTDAAPAGFGLGEFAAAGVTDCNELTKNGWYSTTAEALNTPFDVGLETVVLVISNGTIIEQIAFYNNNSIMVPYTRFYNGSSWTEWDEIVLGENIEGWLTDYVKTEYLDGEISWLWGMMDDHGYNTDNPHQVTAAQVGAVPEDQLADKVSDIINDDYNIDGPISEVINSSIRALADTISKENTDFAIIDRLLVSALSEDNKLTYSDPETGGDRQVTPEQVGAAPAGYGFGENAAKAMNWNNHYRSGVYKEKTNSPDGAKIWYGISCVSHYGESANIAFNPDSTNGFTMALRHQKSGTFEEWEYVNPPMVEGVEYRTSERFNGKPVYAKLISVGYLPASRLSKWVTVSEDRVDVIEIKGFMTRDDNAGYFPIPSNHDNNDETSVYIAYAAYIASSEATMVNILPTKDMSAYSAYLTVKYTKN